MTLEVAMRLQNLRKKNSLSQEELADKLGVSRQAVSKWERAEASPDTDNLIALARLYGVSLDELVGNSPSESSFEDAEEPAGETNPNEEGEGAGETNPKEEEFFFSDEESEQSRDEGKKGIHIDSDGDHVHIGWGGISIDSEEGDHVHIDKSGIHVDSADGEYVHVSPDGTKTASEGAWRESEKGKKQRKILAFVSSFTALGATIAYILLGALGGWWHPAWIIFLAIPVVPSIFEAVFKKNANKFCYPVFATAVFLLLGTLFGLWHPAWVVFLTIPIYYEVVKLLKK